MNFSHAYMQKSTTTAQKLYSSNWQGKSTDVMFKINHQSIERKTLEKLKMITDCPADIRFVKDLTFVIKRAQKPLIITAAKFSVLSLTSFTKVWKNAIAISVKEKIKGFLYSV